MIGAGLARVTHLLGVIQMIYRRYRSWSAVFWRASGSVIRFVFATVIVAVVTGEVMHQAGVPVPSPYEVIRHTIAAMRSS